MSDSNQQTDYRIKMNRNLYLSEALGTFVLVLFGCGAIVVNDSYQNILGHSGIALSFGLVVMILIYSIGNISGAHLNPAVTVGFWLAGRLRASWVLPYMSAQCFGAISAALLLRFLFPDHTTLGATLPSVDLLRCFILEALFTFLLMFVILNVSTGHMEKGIMAGVAVGATIALEALVGGPMTGASMNPARSLGPALISGQWQHLWIYLTAPIVGALCAQPTCRWIQGEECCQQQPIQSSTTG